MPPTLLIAAALVDPLPRIFLNVVVAHHPCSAHGEGLVAHGQIDLAYRLRLALPQTAITDEKIRLGFARKRGFNFASGAWGDAAKMRVTVESDRSEPSTATLAHAPGAPRSKRADAIAVWVVQYIPAAQQHTVPILEGCSRTQRRKVVYKPTVAHWRGGDQFGRLLVRQAQLRHGTRRCPPCVVTVQDGGHDAFLC